MEIIDIHIQPKRSRFKSEMLPPVFCENYEKFYFDAKHTKKGLNRGGEIVGAFCFKNAFLADIGYYHNVIF